MRLFIILLFLPLFSYAVKPNKTAGLKLKSGSWRAVLELNESDELPFFMTIDKSKEGYVFTIENGDEKIRLNTPIIKNDSIFIRFPFFNSELIITSHQKKYFTGKWHNYNKGRNYSIPFTAMYGSQERFTTNDVTSPLSIDGKWQIEFEPGSSSAYPALGVFSQNDRRVSGTFLTETGDYRFLAGNVSSDSLYLSCFDGTHAFLFKAQLKNDSLYGKFFSGNHWQSEWLGFRNEQFQLGDPEKLTYLVKEDSFRFSLKDLSGEDFSYPNQTFENKVVIIQIMGSWCPNCLDETQYFKSLYSNYHDKGLEIISIGYEAGKTFDEQVESITKLKTKLELPFTFLVGGTATKSLASEHFSMLNEVISFPTAIFIGRDGSVRRVHTGFNGPGTGMYYTEYVQRTNSLIESLLAE